MQIKSLDQTFDFCAKVKIMNLIEPSKLKTQNSKVTFQNILSLRKSFEGHPEFKLKFKLEID